jgi:apolipoprotein D and lipocalin family protein
MKFHNPLIKMAILVSAFIIFLVILNGCATTAEREGISMEVVKNVDVNKYAGVWYEIARLPNSFEKDLVGVTATYTLRDDGKIDVLNQGYVKTLDGRLKKTKAIAKIPDPGEPGKLKVYFFLFFGSDYFIMELDQDNYKYALVGSSSINFLWILSRTPQMDPEIYTMLVAKARQRGYPVDKLIKVPQKEI